MYEVFEHTADIGLRVRAADLNALYADAGRALFSLIVANPESVRLVDRFQLEIAGDRYDDLLFDWLAELLYKFDGEHLLVGRFEVCVDAKGLKATLHGEPVDRHRHELDMEIKAITYHGLKVERQDGQWLAEVIVDI
jgi:SHS2 domain-containing protein